MSEKQKTRHWFWTEVILISVICVFAVTGCGGKEKRAEEIPLEPAATETVATFTTKPKPKPTKKPGKKTEKPKETFDLMKVTKGDIEANFDEALKHVTICGKKMSFPFTLDDLGEEFDVEEEPYQKGKDLLGKLIYCGKEVNTIWIKNGRMKGNIRKKLITFFEVSAWDSVNIDFELCGVSLGVSEAYVNELWGVDKKDDWYYRKGGKKGENSISVSYDLDGELKTIDVSLQHCKK